MSLTKKLNVYLANQQVMYIKLHNLHWYVKGTSFFTLHVKFEELYDQTAEMVDDVAERILAISKKPVASLKGALEIATIKELSDEYITSNDSVKVLLEDFKTLRDDTSELISLSEEAHDVVTADLLTGYLASYEKTLWMLHAYLD